MTLPSTYLDKVAEILDYALPAEVNVEVIDRLFGTRDADYVTIPYPSVLIACARMKFEGQYNPPVATGEFVAACISRLDETTGDLASAGDVAMNLAALVAANVEGQRWEGLGFSSVRNLRVETLQSMRLSEKDLNGWAVRWEQDFEVTFAGPDAEQFKKLGITIAMGDANTPDAEAEYVRPEEAPP